MSLNEKKDGEDPNKLAVSQNIQDELARVIYMSLTNIAIQVDNLNKHAEGILGALCKEVDKISCRYNTIQEHVIQLNNSITAKETSKGSLKPAKPKISQSASIQTELDYPSNPLPAKICNTREASVQTSLNMSSPYCQDDPQVLEISNCQDTESLMIPCYQDDLMIPYCQHNQQHAMIPYCIDNDQGLVILPEISYYFETCEEKFLSGVKEQVQERVRKKNQNVAHPTEPEKGPQMTLMGNDINVDHIQPTCTELSHSNMDLSAECSVFSTYSINEISKVLTKAVGKVLASPPRPQRKKVRYLRNKDTYVSNGVGKKEIEPQATVKNHPELEMFVSPSPQASPPHLRPDWLAMLRDSKTECPASKIHSQTQFPSPILRTPTATHRCDCLQTSMEVGIQTTKEDFFPFTSSPPESYEMIAHTLLKENSKRGEAPPMCTSPLLLQRTKDKVSDILVHASFAQSPPSLDYPFSRPLFSKSPKLSTSKSPRSAVLSTPRSSHQPPTRFVDPVCSESSNAAVPTHSSLESYQNSAPLSESFSQSSGSSVSSARCASDYTPTRSVSPRHFSARTSRFSIPSSGKTYIEQSTGNLVPPSQQPSSLKSKKSITLRSVFSFPQSASSRVPSPPTLSVLQYSADSVSSDSKQPPAYNKERSTLMDSIRKGVLLHNTEEHCILKAQIEISKT